MTDNEIIKEATEAYEQNLSASVYVGDLLRIIKQRGAEISVKNKLLDKAEAEIERLSDKNRKCIYLSDDETTEFCVDGACPKFKTEAMIKAETINAVICRLDKKMQWQSYANWTIVRGFLANIKKEMTE